MPVELLYFKTMAGLLIDRLRRDERGISTTETVIITAVLAALALAATAIIVTKVTDKASSIQTG